MRLFREPLLHFVIVALGLMALGDQLWPQPDPRHIVAGQDEIEDFARNVMRVEYANLSPAEKQNVAHTFFTEEVLYREAIALGLDTMDRSIRVRLIDQMSRFAEQLQSVDVPTEAELIRFYGLNPDLFLEQPSINFKHLYFTGDDAMHRATAALATLGCDPGTTAASDRFIYLSNYVERTRRYIKDQFGELFAETLFERPAQLGCWQGPISSDHGLHLVFVHNLTPQRLPEFNEISALVLQELLKVRRAENREAMIAKLQSEYSFEISTP